MTRSIVIETDAGRNNLIEFVLKASGQSKYRLSPAKLNVGIRTVGERFSRVLMTGKVGASESVVIVNISNANKAMLEVLAFEFVSTVAEGNGLMLPHAIDANQELRYLKIEMIALAAGHFEDNLVLTLNDDGVRERIGAPISGTFVKPMRAMPPQLVFFQSDHPDRVKIISLITPVGVDSITFDYDHTILHVERVGGLRGELLLNVRVRQADGVFTKTGIGVGMSSIEEAPLLIPVLIERTENRDD